MPIPPRIPEPRDVSAFESLQFILGHPVNRGQPLAALARFVRWQVGSRVLRAPIVFDWVGGARFLVRRGESGLTGNVYCGLHEFAEMAYVLHVLREDDIFIDVGANAGSYTLLACAARKARGYSFEPLPGAFERLVDNLRLNRLDDRVRAFNVCVADAAGHASLSTDQDCMNHVLGPTEVEPNHVTVPAVTLDAALEGVSPHVVKIDVEGFEAMVIKGADRLLRSATLHSVIMEVNGSGMRYGQSDAHLVEIMDQYGFRPYDYEPFSRRLSPSSNVQGSVGSCIFIRDLAFAGERTRTAPKQRVFNVLI